MTLRTQDLTQAGTHAARPAATAVAAGTLYSCSDHSKVYRSNGSTWSDWINVSGGGILDPRPLFPASLHATYGDDFAAGSIDAKWSTVGTAPTVGLAILGQSWANVSYNGASNLGMASQVAPAGDFTLRACLSMIVSSQSMAGIGILDGSGNGIAVTPYDAGANFYVSNIVAYAYNAGTPGPANAGAWQQEGPPAVYELAKVGTTYTARISKDGRNWLSVGARTGPATATAFGFGRFGKFGAANLAEIRCDWFDVT